MKYQVRLGYWTTTYGRVFFEVEADTPAEARERLHDQKNWIDPYYKDDDDSGIEFLGDDAEITDDCGNPVH